MKFLLYKQTLKYKNNKYDPGNKGYFYTHLYS